MDAITSFGKGVLSQGWDTVKGIGQVIAHPVDTAEGVYHAATHPRETWEGIRDGVSESFSNNPAEASGRAVFEVAALFTPAAFTKIGKAARLARAADAAGDAGKVARAADAAGDAGKVARAADAAGDAGKAGRAADAAGDAGKAGRAVSSNTALFDELTQSGVKFTRENVVSIGRNADGKVVFLEQGNARAGLAHIRERHATDFAARGINESQIPSAVMQAVTEGKAVGTIGTGRNARTVYEFAFEGKTQRIAVGEANNGFIVTAHPAH